MICAARAPGEGAPRSSPFNGGRGEGCGRFWRSLQGDLLQHSCLCQRYRSKDSDWGRRNCIRHSSEGPTGVIRSSLCHGGSYTENTFIGGFTLTGQWMSREPRPDLGVQILLVPPPTPIPGHPLGNLMGMIDVRGHSNRNN